MSATTIETEEKTRPEEAEMIARLGGGRSERDCRDRDRPSGLDAQVIAPRTYRPSDRRRPDRQEDRRYERTDERDRYKNTDRAR